MIITKTPYRLSLFGGGTDYPAWYTKHPSRCVSAAMAHYCYVHVKHLPPFFNHSIRLAYSKDEYVNTIDEIEHPSIRECLRYRNIKGNISISHDGDLPARSGIGSSSSFTVGLLHALYRLQGIHLPKEELARIAISVEQNNIGENVGIQDQIVAALGGIQLINMNQNGWTSSDVKLPQEYKDELESHIMLAFSGVSRFAEVQSKKKVENIQNQFYERRFKEISELAEEAIDCLYKQKDMMVIGELLHKGWEIKRGLAEGVTEPWIDDIYYSAIENGAYGGKLMGAGGGGFFMFLVPPHEQEEFKKQMKDIRVWVPFNFDNEGTQVILDNS